MRHAIEFGAKMTDLSACAKLASVFNRHGLYPAAIKILESGYRSIRMDTPRSQKPGTKRISRNEHLRSWRMPSLQIQGKSKGTRCLRRLRPRIRTMLMR